MPGGAGEAERQRRHPALGQIIANTFHINGNGGTIKVTDDDLFEAVIVAAGLVD